MATDELITDIVNRLGFQERDEIARRKSVYSARDKRGFMVALIWSVAYLVILTLVAVILLSVSDADIDAMAGDISHIWGLFVAVLVGQWIGEYSFKKSLIRKISEGADIE